MELAIGYIEGSAELHLLAGGEALPLDGDFYEQRGLKVPSGDVLELIYNTPFNDNKVCEPFQRVGELIERSGLAKKFEAGATEIDHDVLGKVTSVRISRAIPKID